MTDTFLKWAKFVSPHEGGIADDKDDKGGLTNKGLTFVSFKSIAPLINWHKPIDVESFKALTDSEVLNFKLWYWNNANLDLIKNPAIAMFLADINWAYLGAGKFAQRTLNNYFGTNLALDNVLGKITANEINKINPTIFYSKMNEQRKIDLNNFIKKYPEQSKFKKGWFARLDDLYNLGKNYLPEVATGGVVALLFFLQF